MTQEQKTRIAQLRQQNVGYASIARELSLSINTVKAFCRRNDLAGTRNPAVETIETLSRESPDIDLPSGPNRGNSTTTVRTGSPENTGLSGAQPFWDVSVSYADVQDENAVADVLSMLMNASYYTTAARPDATGFSGGDTAPGRTKAKGLSQNEAAPCMCFTPCFRPSTGSGRNSTVVSKARRTRSAQ